MDEFSLIQQFIDAALKHGRHNQKLHGRRGGGGGVSSPPGAVPSQVSSASGAAGAAGAAGIPSTDPWASGEYRPSKESQALVAQFAAMEQDPNGFVALTERLQAAGRRSAQIGKEYDAARKEYTRTQANGAQLSELSRRSDEALAEFNQLIVQKNAVEEAFSVHPLLQIRPGRDDLTQNIEAGYVPGRPPKGAADTASIFPVGSMILSSMVASSEPFSGYKQNIVVRRGDRSKFDPNINHVIMTVKSTTTLVHELAHAMERRNPVMNERAMQFLRKRTEGEPIESMTTLYKRAQGETQAYGSDEKGKADRFIEPYMGKFYRDRGSTEIISMGLEFMMKDPVGFAKRDPEHFAFVLDVIRTPSSFRLP